MAGGEESSDASASFAHNDAVAFATQLCLLQFETCYLLSALQMEVSVDGQYNCYWHCGGGLLPKISVADQSLVGSLPARLACILISFRRIREWFRFGGCFGVPSRLAFEQDMLLVNFQAGQEYLALQIVI